MTNFWLQQRDFPKNFFIRPTIIFSITASGLPDSRAMSICTGFSRSTTAGSRSASTARPGWRRRCASRPAAEGLIVPGQRHQHADLAHAVGGGVVHIGRHVSPSIAAMRRSDMFSPMVATLSVIVAPTGLAAQIGRLQRLDIGHAERGLGDLGHHLLELGVLGDEIGLGVDLDRDALAALDLDAPRGPRRRCGRISWRPWPGPWCAASRPRLPCRHRFSVSAFLASIMPAPVFRAVPSPCAAVIAIFGSPQSINMGSCPGAPSRPSQPGVILSTPRPHGIAAPGSGLRPSAGAFPRPAPRPRFGEPLDRRLFHRAQIDAGGAQLRRHAVERGAAARSQ
jgi:hypothetical protein